MYVIREVVHCKPGKVSALVAKFKGLSAVVERLGYPGFRLMTDVSGEPFWTLIVEGEIETLEAYNEMQQRTMADAEAQGIMEGYHDLVIDGRREIYKLES